MQDVLPICPCSSGFTLPFLQIIPFFVILLKEKMRRISYGKDSCGCGYAK